MSVREDLARANELYNISQSSLSGTSKALDSVKEELRVYKDRLRGVISSTDKKASKKNNELTVALLRLEETKEKLLDSKRSVELLSAWKSKAIKKLKRQGR